MREKLKRFFFLLPFFFFSCATQSQVNSLDLRISQLEFNLYRLEKKIEDQKKQLSSVRENMADLLSELDLIKDEIRKIRGYSEENRFLLKRMKNSKTLEEISERLERLEGRIRKIYGYLGLEESVRNTKDSEKLYNLAISLYKKGKYEEAVLKFKEFLKKYPETDLSDNAYFWIGECYMELGEYEKAILSYHELIKRYPKGNKVPSAMLRQAQAFKKIGDRTSAKLILKRLIRKYPKTKEAKIARKLLKKI